MKTWWKEGVIYQIYPRSYKDTNDDRIGDIPGIIDKLDYLNDGTDKSLGIDAIWLSPVNSSPMQDFGYDISDYRSIDPIFGNTSDFKILLDECHKRNIKVIMDLVVNHTSDQHPWFLESRSSKNNPKHDWYIWHTGIKRNPPNNWQSCFGGPAWEYNANTEEYYLHSFLKEQPDLNWRNPQVKEAVYDIIKFWLEMGVDGFRLDVVNFYFKDALFRNNPMKKPDNIKDWITNFLYPYGSQIHLYDKDQEEMYDLLKEMRELVDSYGEKLLLGEVGSDNNTEMATKYYGKDNDGLHLSFNFDFLHSPWKSESFKKIIQEWEKALPSWAWPTYVLSNHDIVRHISRYGKSANSVAIAKVAITMLLTLRGTPVIYYGEEIGMREGKIPRKMIKDPPGKKFWPLYKGRDGCRTPMQWDDTPNAGFSTRLPWLPINSDFRINNVLTQDKEPESLLNTYRKLIWLRKNSPVLKSGSLEFLNSNNSKVLSYKRTIDNEFTIILLNLSEKEEVIRFSEVQELSICLSLNSRRSGLINSDYITMKPYEVIISKNINNIGG